MAQILQLAQLGFGWVLPEFRTGAAVGTRHLPCGRPIITHQLRTMQELMWLLCSTVDSSFPHGSVLQGVRHVWSSRALWSSDLSPPMPRRLAGGGDDLHRCLCSSNCTIARPPAHSSAAKLSPSCAIYAWQSHRQLEHQSIAAHGWSRECHCV